MSWSNLDFDRFGVEAIKFTFAGARDLEIRIHKSLLCKVSEVFESMYRRPIGEHWIFLRQTLGMHGILTFPPVGHEHGIELPDTIDPEVMKLLIHWAYTRQIDVTEYSGTVRQSFLLAHKLVMPFFVKHVVKRLKRRHKRNNGGFEMSEIESIHEDGHLADRRLWIYCLENIYTRVARGDVTFNTEDWITFKKKTPGVAQDFMKLQIAARASAEAAPAKIVRKQILGRIEGEEKVTKKTKEKQAAGKKMGKKMKIESAKDKHRKRGVNGKSADAVQISAKSKTGRKKQEKAASKSAVDQKHDGGTNGENAKAVPAAAETNAGMRVTRSMTAKVNMGSQATPIKKAKGNGGAGNGVKTRKQKLKQRRDRGNEARSSIKSSSASSTIGNNENVNEYRGHIKGESQGIEQSNHSGTNNGQADTIAVKFEPFSPAQNRFREAY